MTEISNELIKNIIKDLSKKDLTDNTIQKIFRKYPKLNSGLFKKSEILEHFNKSKNTKNEIFMKNIKMKNTRTVSGVTPVTVLTKPFPCPGKCIFCPNDVRMPKSYLSDEPGAQRANRNNFDPYAQTFNRLLAYKNIGHPTDKVELIILGGTWTSYPETYQIWFVNRCFNAMNDFNEKSNSTYESKMEMPYEEKSLDISKKESYNSKISKALVNNNEKSSWEELFKSQEKNVNSQTRCVGLVIETRPDEITEKEVIRIRKLGATKTQIGFQSLNDKVLELNNRGHNVETTRNAVKLLRQAGFKIHAHWMPNLYGSNPENDINDFKKMFKDADFMPDELKVYPCSLIKSAELMDYYKKGLWKPYSEDELKYVLKEIYKITPEYCRITRMIRDIGSQDIVVGNKKTNFRQIVEKELGDENAILNEVRSREIRGQKVSLEKLNLDVVKYQTSISTEYFLQYITKERKIAGLLRLSIPKIEPYIAELKAATIIREVHIYGQSIEIGSHTKGKAQHLGLGKGLIKKAEEISKKDGFNKIAVISAIGTREYYSKLGYHQIDLYQVKEI